MQAGFSKLSYLGMELGRSKRTAKRWQKFQKLQMFSLSTPKEGVGGEFIVILREAVLKIQAHFKIAIFAQLKKVPGVACLRFYPKGSNWAYFHSVDSNFRTG